MHGLIYQISDQPIQKSDYITSSDFDGGDNPFDYCRDMNEKEINEAIVELANILPKEMFICKGREIIFNGGNKDFFERWQNELRSEIDSITPRVLSEGGEGTSLYQYKINKKLEDALKTASLFVDKEYTGFYTVKSTEFLLDSVTRFKPGDKFYIGGVLDYHY
jgi:hypothetical protein